MIDSYRKDKSSIYTTWRALFDDLIYVRQNTFRYDGFLYGFAIYSEGRLFTVAKES